MNSMFFLHRIKWLGLLLLANAGLMLYLSLGELKPVSIWAWTDITGEGSSALLVLAWTALMLKGRPAGRVTNLLFVGLACLFLSLWMDTLDEFVALPEAVMWDHWLESAPMPVGFVLLTVGIYHWHREQLAINAQMVNRERHFREHRQFDKLTPLADAGYLRSQLALALPQAESSQQPLSLLTIDLDDFHQVNERYGHQEGDRVLQLVCQLLLMSLRRHDLLCRLAGDRFALLLPNTLEEQAQTIAREISASIAHLACRSAQQGERILLRATVVAVMARQDDVDSLLQRSNLAMAHAKQALQLKRA
ncbi:GGDEF domain-containing protein [Halopseudomonas oceani]|uniref:GGDEF domain-containing protein n=1 Tax=Halopseudomonas oceani TaxID=1708783 RepID=A0A2P4EUU2_9GAMM|nr:GGDEF domain-containing protein [Halopseudomonas oceani]POB03246.1 GGDEF domain-containing protein [Halopseudomonas oceani]GGE49644.1 GGDEF domain-containing protein [Halopseudomonas oceani]